MLSKIINDNNVIGDNNMPTPEKPIAWLDFEGLICELEKVANTYPPEDKGFFSYLTIYKHRNQKHASNLAEIRSAIASDLEVEKLKEAQLLLKLHDVISPIVQSTLLLTNIKNALILYPPFQTLNGLLPGREEDESDDKYVNRLSSKIEKITKDVLCDQFVKMAELRGVKYKTENLISEFKSRVVV